MVPIRAATMKTRENSDLRRTLFTFVLLKACGAAMMLIKELRVERPGEQEQPINTLMREADDRGGGEYKRGTAGVGSGQAAAIAAEISRDRRVQECRPPEAVSMTPKP